MSAKDGGPSYFPVSMLERDGQHMGVVTKALEKEVPPSSMMRRVLFIACIEPADRDSLHNEPQQSPVITFTKHHCHCVYLLTLAHPANQLTIYRSNIVLLQGQNLAYH